MSLSDRQTSTVTPAFAAPLHVGRPNVGDRQRLMERIEGILDRGWLTNDGPLVKEFERKIADFANVRHCVAMCNGTVALEIAIRALDLTGEVIIPSFTFVATAHALQWQEITPVFCDIDATHSIDPSAIERLITPRTSAIIGVHCWGTPCDVDALTAIASKHRLRLLFDAAHALGTTYHGTSIGNFGDAEVFSFHATKFVNSFEGGAVVTNDDSLAHKLRLMRNFGFAGFDNVEHVGTNGKMAEVCAAMGITSLESVDDFIAINRANFEEYSRQLAGVAGVSLYGETSTEARNYQYVVLEIDEQTTGVGRDEFIAWLQSHNVLARRYFYPGCHRMQPYRLLYPNSHLWLPNTEQVASRIVVLPTGTQVAIDDIRTICSLIRDRLAV